MIDVNEQQLQLMLETCVDHRLALVVHGTDAAQLRDLCRTYDNVEVVEPFPLVQTTHEQQITLVRLIRPQQREHAMVLPYWPEMPKKVLERVTQVRLTAK